MMIGTKIIKISVKLIQFIIGFERTNVKHNSEKSKPYLTFSPIRL